MLFMIRCVDKDGHQEVRKQNRDAHLAYLDGYRDQVRAAGPTLSDDGESMTGSLLLMAFPDRAAAEAFTAGDPYAKAGLFQSVEIAPWKQVLP